MDQYGSISSVEKDNIAWHATKQALEWVLEETKSLLTY
jgi:hypothetical protein